MHLSQFLLSVFVGLVTARSYILWERAVSRKPIPPPDPPYVEIPSLPHRLLLRIIGVVGGVGGGWVFTEVFGPHPDPWITAGPQPNPGMLVVAAATMVGAFIGASLLTDLYELVRSSRKVTRV
jgi:uncharacterized membrane protein YfcA